MAKKDELEQQNAGQDVQAPDNSDVAWEGSLSANEPVVAPDGHVVLSQEDIDARS